MTVSDGAPMPPAPVLPFAPAYLEKTDRAGRDTHQRELCAELVNGAHERPYLSIIAPKSSVSRIGIVTLKVASSVPIGEIARMMSDSYGYMIRSGYHCAQPLVTDLAGVETLRASSYFYNSIPEIEGFYLALDELISWSG